ncbi:hypothetical protein ANO14919_058380 [Xylariales sp. No.14919]|nr:hypothetical protein F5X98DRAFT_353634 [Xylaria grammica]GAW16412.1 hypothetical protein ANO14919_058380 [Xylariales sp. No.14919]
MATDTNRDALERAIDNADENILRTVLKSMCQNSETCRKEAMGRLVVSRKHEIIELSDSDNEETQEKPKKKQRVEAIQSRYETCATCKKAYDVTLNNDTACQTHEGLLDIDADYFPDDDEIQYGVGGSIDIETDWRREQCPEGFVWECCEERLNGKACVIQSHIPKK